MNYKAYDKLLDFKKVKKIRHIEWKSIFLKEKIIKRIKLKIKEYGK